MRIDLHTHSRVSDGTDAPAELVRAAKAQGLDVVALTDHDTADGWSDAVEAAQQVGLELVRGMEISTDLDGHSVHLLAYLPDPAYPPLAAELAKVLAGRSDRLPRMLARLNDLGIPITVDDVVAATGFDLVIPDSVPQTRTPTAEELDLIRTVIDPRNLRDKEVPA
ncbi:MAG: PHP domain-containing protein [Nocardiaceae bacterium]|nr:PHP domain-containing protein [Nocardiaceae bacterium]